ncbi:hypothetical protein EVAR_31083_1 [Eumeta japonica]|uniref:DDE Tnp4 domain-containing protein n=1 Tax=Eumeta variegata TaxID=151549 RepID=A0A4C1XHU4_EUMVA|nr:hypothetical protein EVAR_31083_1 [Eumeta japonica]
MFLHIGSENLRLYRPPVFRGLPPLCRHLKKGVVPSIFPWTPKPSTSAIERQNRYMERSAKKELFPPQNPIETLTEGYGGSTSDRQIIERCNLMHKCNPGDGIMADRGFNIQDLLAPRDVTLLVPNF